jgi:hypothetical protein
LPIESEVQKTHAAILPQNANVSICNLRILILCIRLNFITNSKGCVSRGFNLDPFRADIENKLISSVVNVEDKISGRRPKIIKTISSYCFGT